MPSTCSKWAQHRHPILTVWSLLLTFWGSASTILLGAQMTPPHPGSAHGPARRRRWARREVVLMAAVTLDIPVEAEVAQAFRNSTSQTLQTIQQQGQFLVSAALGFS